LQLADITVEVRDKSLKRLGLIRPEELNLELIDQHNNVGSWKLVLATEHPLADALRQPGSGIIVTGLNDVLFSGPMVKHQPASNADDPQGTITFEGVDDTIALADALAYPDPTNPDPTTQTLAHDVRTGPIETLMHAFVNANIGPSAPSERRKANLIMGTDLGRGPTITKSARFPVLGNLLVSLATLANLGFRVIQRGDNLVFETYEVVDRTAEIRLDVRNSTLAGQRVAISTPGATRVIVAGQGELVDRQFLHVTNSDALAAEAAWGRRIERFVDQRNTDDEEELEKAGEGVLAEEGFTSIAAQAVPMEDSAMPFGDAWSVGDQVSVVVDDQELSTTVTGATIKVDREGFRVGTVLGDPTGFDVDAALAKRVKNTEARVSELERNAENNPPGVKYISPDDYNNSTPSASYPVGESLLYLTGSQATAGGWEFGQKYGVVRTIHPAGNSDVMQIWQRVSSPPTAPELWIRHGNISGWAPWERLARVNETPVLDALSASQQIVFGGDTNIRRSAANELRTDDSLVVGGNFSVLGIGSRVVKYKTADESVTNSTTQQNDDHLFWSVAANAVYSFEVNLIYTGALGDNVGELAARWSMPSGASLTWGSISQIWSATSGPAGAASFQGYANDTTNPSQICLLGTSNAPMLGILRGTLITGGSSGTFRLQWSQWSPSTTPTVVHKGSWGALERIA